MKRDIKQKTLREQHIKPRLGFGGDGWLMTFLSMNDNRANRTIEFVCSHGERFELELSANPKHKSFIALHLRWKPLPAPPHWNCTDPWHASLSAPSAPDQCPICKSTQRLPTFTCHNDWHYQSAPTSEPVRELVEALQKVCDAMRTFQRREQRSYFASDIFEAEGVLARYQK